MLPNGKTKRSKTERLLLELGALPKYEGFRQMDYAISLIQKDPTYLLAITKRLYPDVAEHYHTNAAATERNLRTLATLMWNRNPKKLEEIAHFPLEKRPPVSQLLSILCAYLSDQQFRSDG